MSGLFAILGFFGSSFVTDVKRYPWGFYPLYGHASRPFLFLTAACVSMSLWLFWTAYHETPAGQRRTMLRSFFFALAIGSLGLIDFLASYGVRRVYPIGYFARLYVPLDVGANNLALQSGRYLRPPSPRPRFWKHCRARYWSPMQTASFRSRIRRPPIFLDAQNAN